MRSTKQGTQGSEECEASTLQQIMETMKALQEANEEYRHEQVRIREEAMAKQERLRAKARADQERLCEETWLNQARLMAEIKASRRNMEEHAHANEELRKTNEETCTVMVDVLPESVPQICHQEMTPNSSFNKSWKSLCRPIISHLRSLLSLV